MADNKYALQVKWSDREPFKDDYSVKTHGTGRPIDGEVPAGSHVILIDDLVTTAASKHEAITILEASGLEVRDVVVLVDREQGGRQELAAKGYRCTSAISISRLLDELEAGNRISGQQAAMIRAYLEGRASNSV